MVIFIIQLVLALSTAHIAMGKGRNPIGWFFIGCIPYGLGLLVALLVAPISSPQQK
jgi:hypothetical protein